MLLGWAGRLNGPVSCRLIPKNVPIRPRNLHTRGHDCDSAARRDGARRLIGGLFRISDRYAEKTNCVGQPTNYKKLRAPGLS